MLLTLALALTLAQDPPKEKPRDEVIRDALRDAKMTIDLPSGSLNEFIETIRTFTGFNVAVVGVDEPDEPVSATFRDLPVETILDLVLNQINLGWEVKDGVIQIGVRGLPAFTTAEVYDIQDLISPIEDLPSREFPDKDSGVTPLTGEQVVGLITDVIDRGTWKGEGKSIEVKAGMLTVRAKSTTHAAIKRLLDEFRKTMVVTHQVEAFLISVPSKEAGDVPVGPVSAEALEKLRAPSRIRQKLSVSARNAQRVNASAGDDDAPDRLVIDVRPMATPGATASVLDVRVAGFGFRSASVVKAPWAGAFVVAVGRNPKADGEQRFVVVRDGVKPSELSGVHFDGCSLIEPAGEIDLLDPPARARNEAATKVVLDLLDDKVFTVDFSAGETLENAIVVIQEQLGRDIVVMPNVREAHEAPNVSLRVANCSARAILRLLLDDRGLTLVQRKGLLVVTDRKEVDEDVGTVLFDLRDVLLTASDDGNGMTEFLMKTVKTMTCGGRWDENPEWNISLCNYLLFVTLPEKGLDELRELIPRLREKTSLDASITLRFTYVEASAEQAKLERVEDLLAGARVLDDISLTGRNTRALKGSLSGGPGEATIEARPTLSGDGKRVTLDLRQSYGRGITASSEATEAVPVGGSRVTLLGTKGETRVLLVIRAAVTP